MAGRHDWKYPETENEFRIMALDLALGTVHPENGISPDNLIRIAETLLRYIKDNDAPAKLMSVR